MDRIYIDELKVFANHGVYDFEKEKGQNFYISAELYVDLQKASLNDNLFETVNYADVCDTIVEYATNNNYDLIEALAEGLSVCLLNKYMPIRKVVVEVKKPEAPVEHSFKNISVKVQRLRHRAYIAFGSNLGDSKEIIAASKKMLEESDNCRITAESAIYRTSAYGVTNQPDFLNGVWELETYLEPENLLEFLHKVEAAGGRVRKEHWGPRTIDLDIVLYDNSVIDSKSLTIPHPDMLNRDFVMRPLSEIAGYVRHPLAGKTINELCDAIKEKHVKKEI